MSLSPDKEITITGQAFLRFVDQSYLASIGSVITQWSMLEVMVDCCIWQISGLRNDYGRIFAAQMQMNDKLDTIQSLLNQRRPIFAQQFKLAADYIRECLQGQRNLVAHGMWATDPITGRTWVNKFGARGVLVDQGRVPWPKEELDQLATDIAETCAWVLHLSQMLPKLRQRPGGLGHKTLSPQNLLERATRKLHALQPPTRKPTLLAIRQAAAKAAKPQKAPKPSAKQRRLAAFAKAPGVK
jgi:hypothetical protein